MSANLTVLFPAEQIASRVLELGLQLRAEHPDQTITLIAVLKGSVLFLADLARAIPGDVRLEFLGVASYHGGTSSSGAVQITQDLRASIEGQACVIVEDIVDTGLTMDYLLRTLAVRGPRSLKVACLLDKPGNRETDVQVDYVGFTIPDEFVVGYGLDLGELYRNLPYVAVYQP
ncbi:MAG: hypoxanthine phosphoribosyltransferase [Myxococcales bacterium]|nr:hypoxanthine phosphoribosyltransferase [Myxococcales bacterium]